MANQIVHIEVGVTDLLNAKKFYKKSFPHWKIEKQDDIPDYYSCEIDNDNLSMGIRLVDSIEGKGSILFYVNVDDINESIQRITQVGGKVIMEKTYLGEKYGYISRLEDPFGNIIGVWSKS